MPENITDPVAMDEPCCAKDGGETEDTQSVWEHDPLAQVPSGQRICVWQGCGGGSHCLSTHSPTAVK